jgi:hypothetical protein
MSIRSLHRAQAGSAVATAVLLLFIISILMAIVGTGALSSLVSSRTKNDHSVGLASADSGIEKIRSALQAHQLDESNDWRPNAAMLTAMTINDPTAKVLPNSATSDAAGMRPVRLPAAYRFTVREEYDTTWGFWQLYDVLEPRFQSPGSLVTYYLRAWATSKGSTTNITTKPRVFRVTYRPLWFSDYQMVTDAPFVVVNNNKVTVTAPIHSNGYSVQSFLEMDAKGYHTGIYTDTKFNCAGNAKFTTSQDAIIDLGSSPGTCKKGRTNSRQISLLGAEDSFRIINSRCGTTNTIKCVNGQSLYNVTLGAGSLSVTGGGVVPYANKADSQTLTLLLDGPVRVRGTATGTGGKVARVTIASRRRTVTDPNPDVTLDGAGGGKVGARNAGDTVGVLTQGDIILGIGPGYSCLKTVNLAGISEAGSVSIPKQWVTIAPPAVAPA